MAYRDEVLADSPVSYWRLGESAGTTAADEQSANAGTYVNTPTLGVTGALTGDANTAVTFTAASSETVTITNAPLTVNDNFTLECWVKLASTTAAARMFMSVGNDTAARGYGLGTLDAGGSSSNNLIIVLNGVGVFASGYTFADTNWHHVVFVRTTGTGRFYVDGAITATSVTNTPNAPLSGDGATLASHHRTTGGDYRFLPGSLDEPAVYNTALSAARISAHYDMGVNGPPTHNLAATIPISISLTATLTVISPVPPAPQPLVREKPPLRLNYTITTPDNRHYRWAADEPAADNIPNSVTWTDTMPGGFENFDATLPRRPGTDYPDLERLSTITIHNPGGDTIGEYRLERAPRVSGDQMAITPSAVGWQAHLADDKSVREIYVDRNAGRWGEPSLARRTALLNLAQARVLSDWASSTAAGAVVHETGNITNTATKLGAAETWYDAQGIAIGSLYYSLRNVGMANGADANWLTQAFLSDDDIATTLNSGTDHDGADGPTTATLTASGATKTYALVQTLYNAVFTGDGSWGSFWEDIAVYGTHGLAKRAISGEPDGLYDADIIADIVSRAAPHLNYTTGSDGTIGPATFVIPHIVFADPVTAADALTQATRFSLNDWAVWDDRTFYWHQRGARGRAWRARIGPTQLQETGPQVDRLWESVIVAYQDVDGSTRTVGPVGSGADTETDDLRDTDPDNPANRLGITRRDLLTMGISTAAGATEIGRRFLEETKQLSTAGQARLVGYVEDDHGVTWPYHAVRSGDTITFVDAADPSPRRIVRTQKDADTRTCTVDLDAPPEGLAAVLERLQVVLMPLGL